MTNTTALIVGLVAVGGIAAYALTRPKAQTDSAGQDSTDTSTDSTDTLQEYNPGETTVFDVITSPVETIAQTVDKFTGWHISKMSQVTPDLLDHPNIRAMLRVIRRGEGTADEAGYRRIFGGRMFDSFADHPRIKITAGGYTSTAAGAYQFLSSTWDETAAILGLKDFSPASQDIAAVARIVYRKALDDVIRGDLTAALPKLGKEWASMPGSPYGQPTISQQTALNTFSNNGGTFA